MADRDRFDKACIIAICNECGGEGGLRALDVACDPIMRAVPPGVIERLLAELVNEGELHAHEVPVQCGECGAYKGTTTYYEIPKEKDDEG